MTSGCAGTHAAYVMHVRRGEPTHPECRADHARVNAEWRRANADRVSARRRQIRKYGPAGNGDEARRARRARGLS